MALVRFGLIRRTKAKPKPIRVFLQGGAQDLDNEYGHWPLANQQMALALRFAKYDYRFVYGVGGLGAIGLGAGFWGQWGFSMATLTEPVPYSMWVLATGAVLLGIAIWIGTSGDTIVRVGSAGIGEEKSGNVRRIPWYALKSIGFEHGALVANGSDEGGAKYAFRVKQSTSPQAVAWIVSQARERVPDAVELSETESGTIGDAAKKAGEWAEPPPLQVVGKRCAKTDKIIAYEPDARVCPRCERVYHRSHVPKVCVCGNSLAHLMEKEAS